MSNLNNSLFLVLNARGHRFQILKSKLSQYPESSRFGKLKTSNDLNELTQLCDYYNPDFNEFYFDRDPFVLNSLLNFSLKKKLHLSSVGNECIDHIINELNYWFYGKADVYENMFDVCCKLKYNKEKLKLNEEKQYQNKILTEYCQLNRLDFGKMLPGLREKLWTMINQPTSSYTAMVSFKLLLTP